MEYNITLQKELDTVCNLIANASSGTVWRVLRYEPPVPKKTQNKGKSDASGFTTLSDAEGEEKKRLANKILEKKVMPRKGEEKRLPQMKVLRQVGRQLRETLQRTRHQTSLLW